MSWVSGNYVCLDEVRTPHGMVWGSALVNGPTVADVVIEEVTVAGRGCMCRVPLGMINEETLTFLKEYALRVYANPAEFFPETGDGQ